MSEQKSSNWLKFLVAALVVAAGGGAIAYWWLQRGGGDINSPVASAERVPADALLTAFAVVDDRALSQLQQFGTPEAQAAVRAQFEQWESQVVAEDEISFQEDIQPWAGSVTIAVLPGVGEGEAATSEGDVLMVVGIRDKLKALAFANQVKGESEAAVTEENYRDVTVSTVTEAAAAPEPDASEETAADDLPSTYSFAVVGDYLLVSDRLETVKAAIDTSMGAPALADDAQMTSILRSSDDGAKLPLAQLYVADFATFQTWAEEEGNSAPLDPASTPEAMAMQVDVTDTGLHARMAIVPAEISPTVALPPLESPPLDRFPENTWGFAASNGLDRVWQGTVEALQQTPEGEILLSRLRQGFETVGLDADREVFGWMDGTVAFGMVPASSGLMQTVGFGGAVVVETSDRKTAESTLTKLGELVQNSLPIPVSVQEGTIDSLAVTEWQVSGLGAKPEAVVSYGWLEEGTLAIGIDRSILEKLVRSSEPSLADNALFQELQQQFPDRPASMGFLNVEAMLPQLQLPVLERQGTLDADTVALLQSVRGVGITGEIVSDRLTTVEVWLSLLPYSEDEADAAE